VCAGAELAAVVNHKPESRAAFAADYDIPRQYATVEDLLADGSADAVVIGTPNFLHAPQAVAALRAGLHVMVEKPMAMNAAEARGMVEAAASSTALLMIAHCFRFHPELVWLREQLAAGRLGRIIRTKGYGVHVAWGPSGWFSERNLAGGGALADMGVHAIDAARFLLGDPQPDSVYARVGTHYGGYDVDDTGVILVNWQGGVTSYVESGWWQPYSDGPCAATQVYGTLGFGQAFPTELALRESPGADPVRVTCGISPDRVHHPPQSVYDAQMAHFVSCIREGRPPSPGGADGLASMRVLDAAYESARSGRVVNL
jgi:predicted dehydrogenase